MDKIKAKAKAWDADFQRTCQPKKAMCLGCVWVGGESETEEKRGEDVAFLSQFSALVLTDTPVEVKLITTTTLTETPTGDLVCTEVCMCVCVCVCVCSSYTRLHNTYLSSVHIFLLTGSNATDSLKRPVPEEGTHCICVYILVLCVRVYTHVYIHTCTHIHVHVHCIYTCMYMIVHYLCIILYMCMCVLSMYTSVKIILLNEWRCRDVPCEK